MAKDKIPTGAAVEKEIGGVNYGTRHMDPEKVLINGGRLSGLGLSAASILKAAATDVEIMVVIKDCLELAMADGRELGKGDYWKIHFLGKQKDLVEVLVWLLEVHFADFFGAAARVLADLVKRFGESQDFKALIPR